MMSKPKFTPGPWRVDVSWPNLYVRHSGVGWPVADPLSGCEVYAPCATANVGSGFDEKEIRLANAALIAAAPEMYELLEFLMNDPNGSIIGENKAAKIEAVLKKARGEK